MRPSLAICTEASSQIGTGHVIESLQIANLAMIRGIDVSMWISDTAPSSLLERLQMPYYQFHSLDIYEEIEAIKEKLKLLGCKAILFNLRDARNKICSSFYYNGLKILCIDELGNKHLDCDVIINPSIVRKYHTYSSDRKDIKVYTGPQYLSIAPAFAELHQRKRVFRNNIEVISACMGGVDRTGTTLEIMDALANWHNDVVKIIILGGGFLCSDDVHEKAKRFRNSNFRIHHNIQNIETLFFESDVVFTAGGNTLYELACVGTPAIVLYEDEHEKENGISFERLGFGFCIGKGTEVSNEMIISAIEKMEDADIRTTHSQRGKEIVDGKGAKRIVDIIEVLVQQ